jgi:hypothetical protein
MTQEMAGFGAVQEYWADAWQRGVLFLDTLRERGNNYHEQAAQEIPHVLNFPVELVRDGRALKRPVNYGLTRIVPPAGGSNSRPSSTAGPVQARSGPGGVEASETEH